MKLENPSASLLSELLGLIRTFTCLRHHLLVRNIENQGNPNYIPRDLPEESFSAILARSLESFTRHRRLVLVDAPGIAFGKQGGFVIRPVPDRQAQRLLASDPQAYRRHQLEKLRQNLLSEKAVMKLIAQVQVETEVTEETSSAAVRAD